MPKRHKAFTKRIDVSVPEMVRIELIAIAYMMGSGGEYAVPARNFLMGGIRGFREKLDDKKVKEYQEILRNVMIQESIPLDQLPELNKKSPA